MARTTIEESWWTDPRRERLAELVGGLLFADAWAIRLWRLAQEHWGRGRKPIPKDVFEALEAAPKLLKAGLAEERDGGIYAKGSAQHTDWLNQKRQAAKEGGKVSARSRKKKYGTAQPDPPGSSKQTRSTPEAEPNTIEPSGSGSDSGSLPIPSESGAAAAPPAVVEGQKPGKAGKNGVALWLEAYHRKYGVRYELGKQDQGMLTEFRNQRTEAHTAVLFAAYLAMDGPGEGDKLYAKAKHALSLFFRDKAAISVAAQTGVDPSKPKRAELKD